jgi:excisionase family DNA binding protein
MRKTDKATFTLAEAAVLLSCHRETLRRAIKDGELRAARLGREYRISRLDLEAFWTASGGKDLFVRDAAAPGSGAEERVPPAPAGKKKKGRQEQLHLLGEGAAKNSDFTE